MDEKLIHLWSIRSLVLYKRTFKVCYSNALRCGAVISITLCRNSPHSELCGCHFISAPQCSDSAVTPWSLFRKFSAATQLNINMNEPLQSRWSRSLHGGSGCRSKDRYWHDWEYRSSLLLLKACNWRWWMNQETTRLLNVARQPVHVRGKLDIVLFCVACHTVQLYRSLIKFDGLNSRVEYLH